MNKTPCFIFSEHLYRYEFHDSHPFHPIRLRMTMDLINRMHLLKKNQIIPPRLATEEELTLIHDPLYIDKLIRAGRGELTHEQMVQIGIDTDDNPHFPDMHEVASYVVGGTLVAMEQVMSNQACHALHLGGGLHHALRGKASGFCLYNDAAVAIAKIRDEYDAKVLYIDTDAHHGDGVQWAFYNDPQVFTISIHETGKYLFPGTGAVYERGEELGFGSNINIPLDAFTEDDSWLYAFEQVIPKVIQEFKPDVIFSQHGCDAHRTDPQTHLAATMNIYRLIPQYLHQWAHQWCEGRWIAVGGGGYDLYRVVPRAWTYLWAEMTDHPLNDEPIPMDWINHWQAQSPVSLPLTFHDPDGTFPPIPRRAEITEFNERIVKRILLFLEGY
ncbi:acetoin utilization protein AcuC [Hazenella coriacea]|uniref:Acetoin utilization protein AcuC n=1 Tax=Hazenella coriacea TaxID=1179467 RepID=A0A4R3L9Z6_9BACL|nr:acetoin utilization protein AcuC [Hazenella coriacea]TCS95064.1 acetoin utilization protein AcuC [Hazenella coriacea]